MNWDEGFWDSGSWDSPSPPPNSKPNKTKPRMKRNSYYPGRVAQQIIWLENFRNKLPGYKTTLGLTDAQVNGAVADARWLIYLLVSWLPAARAWAQSCTDAIKEAQNGTGGSPQSLPVFTPPAPPSGVVPVNPGALGRIFALVQTIKDSSGTTDPIETDLGLVGSEQSGPDLDTIQPVFVARIVANQVFLDWDWGGSGNSAFLDMLELQVDRADGKGWVPLVFDSTPGYTDTTPFPATATKWKYRGIYRVNDAQVGQWSNDVTILVG